MQKAQAALEFLMTYGWAIMVVLVAIGALANMDVLSIDKLSPKKCSLESGIACTDSIVNENSVSLALVNSLGNDITITSVEAGKCNAANIGKLENGKKIVVPLSGCENIPNKKFKEDVNIYYRGESGLDRVMKGTIIGTVETGFSVVLGEFFQKAEDSKEFDKGAYDNTEVTPDGKIKLGAGQVPGTYKPSGKYTSKIYDSYSANTEWKDITVGKGGPYKEEIGRASGDSNGASAPYVDTSGLSVAAHFNKEEENGESDNKVKDFSENSNDATCSGNSCPSYDSDDKKLGDKAMKFDGVDDILKHNQGQEEFNNKKITVETWAKLDSTSETGYIKDFKDEENKNAPSVLYDGAEKKFVVNDGVSDIIKYDKAPLASEWFHITATMDFESDNYKLYYNGEDVSAEIVSETKSVTHTTDSDFKAGALDRAAVVGVSLAADVQLAAQRPTHSFNYGTIKEATPDGYAPCSGTGTDHKGADWSPTGTISGDHCNVGKFTVSGTVIAGGTLRVFAQSANIIGTLSADARGYGSSEGIGRGQGYEYCVWCSGGGAGYGGVGAPSGQWGPQGYGSGGITYGSFTKPTDLGSGGGAGRSSTYGAPIYPGGDGGGAIFLNIQDTLAVSGTISSQGGQGSTAGVNTNYGFNAGGGGSGGSIWIITSTLQGSGRIIANGGAGGVSSVNGGGAGGGRIAVYYDNIGSGSLSYSAYGGGTITGGAGTANILTWPEISNAYESSGNLVSPSINIDGIDRLDYTDLSWNANTNGGTIKFQLAYSSDGNSWSSFLGPDGTSLSFFTSSGQAIPSLFDGNKYIKYKAFLETSDPTKTPKLNDITIKYKSLPTIKTVGSIGTIGASNAASGDKLSWNGLLDETMIWNRILSSEEVLEHYKRGALDLYVEVRSCDDPKCGGEEFTGHYIKQGVNSIDVPKNRYFQYRVNFGTEDDIYSPELEDVKVGYTVS